jgi:hypothetical protein
LKADSYQQGKSSSGIPPRGADISQSREAEKTTEGRDLPVVRNPHLPLKEVISVEAGGSGMPPQGASCSWIPVDWELVVLAYHNREFVVPADLWIGSQ